MVILVATDDELRLARKHLGEYEIVKTGVGAGNVIRSCSELLLRGVKEKIVNVGFCGSNSIPVGSVVKVSRTWRLMDNVVEFVDWRNGHELSADGVPCYTANSFVLKTDIVEPCAFDMELNYIAAFPLPLAGSVKIVSDNLSLDKYEHSIRHSEDETWEEVKSLLAEFSASAGF